MKPSMIECPGCHLVLPDRHLDPPDRLQASGECFQLFSDLQCYSVSKQDRDFIHQHVADIYAAQHAGGRTRPITVVFGLIGLHLALEHGYTGKEVQHAHMAIARVRKDWPLLDPPGRPAGPTVRDVLEAATNAEKDAMIRRWMAAVWEIWSDRHARVRKMTESLLQPAGK